MTAFDRTPDNAVLAAWAPAGWGRIVVVLGQGVVIHKVVVSLRAGATGVAQTLIPGAGPDGPRPTRSPFIDKVLRHGVEGLLASPRKTLIPWGQIVSAEYRALALYRGRMIIRTADAEHKLKFLQNTVVVGDPVAAFTAHLTGRFTSPPAE